MQTIRKFEMKPLKVRIAPILAPAIREKRELLKSKGQKLYFPKMKSNSK